MLERISLSKVRGYTQTSISLPPGLGVFFGPNGVGKTTVLEAVYFLATLRSFRTTRLSDLLRQGEDVAALEGWVTKDRHHLRVELTGTARHLFRDGKKSPSAAKFCESLQVVALAPEHGLLIHGAPEERRRFLDRTLFSIDPSYLSTAQRYRQVLRQKQALLRQDLSLSTYLDRVAPWNVELAIEGEKVRNLRRALVANLCERTSDGYSKIAEPLRTEFRISYAASELSIEDEIVAMSTREHAAGRALVGPHRDDLHLHLDGQPAAVRASQGERASIILALKWAEMELIEEERGEKVILLLDDLGSTLDFDRRTRLFGRLSDDPHQTLVTTSDATILELAEAAGARHFCGSKSDLKKGFSIAGLGGA